MVILLVGFFLIAMVAYMAELAREDHLRKIARDQQRSERQKRE
jgi:heme exporter protein D